MKPKTSLTAPLLTVVVYLLIFTTRYIDAVRLGTGTGRYLSMIAIELLIFVLPAIVYCRLKKMGEGFSLNLRLFSPGSVGFILFAALMLITGTTLIRCVQVYLFGMNDFSYVLYQTFAAGTEWDTAGTLYTGLAFAAVPAVAEEFLFRTVLLSDYNESGAATVDTILVTALLYAMLSFRLEELPLGIFCGILFAFVTYVTRSSLAAMLAHILYNLYGVFFERYLITVIKKPENVIFFIFTVTLLFLMFAVFAFSEAERIQRHNAVMGFDTPAYVLKREAARKEDPSRRGKMFAELFLSPGLILCIAVFIIIATGMVPV